MLEMLCRQNYVLILAVLASFASYARADGSAIGQIYSPYVQPLEKEIEWVWVHDERSDSVLPTTQRSKVGYGTSLWEGVYTEVSVSDVNTEDADYHTLELETVWQLTEQGEYGSDWGLLFEVERDVGREAQEVALGVLNQLDMGRFSLLTNALLAYEWGRDINDELESVLAMQLRYRWRSEIEPTVEFFQAQNTTALGLGLTGVVRLQAPNQFRWNLVALEGLGKGPDYSVKFELEYEFF